MSNFLIILRACRASLLLHEVVLISWDRAPCETTSNALSWVLFAILHSQIRIISTEVDTGFQHAYRPALGAVPLPRQNTCYCTCFHTCLLCFVWLDPGSSLVCSFSRWLMYWFGTVAINRLQSSGTGPIIIK